MKQSIDLSFFRNRISGNTFSRVLRWALPLLVFGLAGKWVLPEAVGAEPAILFSDDFEIFETNDAPNSVKWNAPLGQNDPERRIHVVTEGAAGFAFGRRGAADDLASGDDFSA